MKKLFFLGVISLLIFSNCETKTKTTVNKQTIALGNTAYLTIQKTNIDRTSIGVFSRHNYGTSHFFKYDLHIDKNDIRWQGSMSEPKEVSLYKDNVFLKLLEEKLITNTVKDTLKDSIITRHNYQVKKAYLKHIDKRYFFKLFGDAFWLNIDSTTYHNAKLKGKAFVIPNDNEFSNASIK